MAGLESITILKDKSKNPLEVETEYVCFCFGDTDIFTDTLEKYLGPSCLYSDCLYRSKYGMVPEYYPSYHLNFIEKNIINSPSLCKVEYLKRINFQFDPDINLLTNYEILMKCRHKTIPHHIPEFCFLMDRPEGQISTELTKIRQL